MIAHGQLVEDFAAVSVLAGTPVAPASIRVEVLPKPRRPPSSLPPGKMAVYAFLWGDRCLKVGKAGPNSP